MNMDQTATGGKRWPQGKIRPFVYTLVLPNFITFIICHFELYILLILELLFKIWSAKLLINQSFDQSTFWSINLLIKQSFDQFWSIDLSIKYHIKCIPCLILQIPEVKVWLCLSTIQGLGVYPRIFP